MDTTRTQLEDVVRAFCGQCQSIFDGALAQLAETDAKMGAFEAGAVQVRDDMARAVSKCEADMEQVRQALTLLCQSF